MKRYRLHLIGLGIVTAWAVFASAYLGVEDGSSGSGLLGWISAMFFLPGGWLMQTLKGSHSNADLPPMAATGWLTFSLAALAVACFASRIWKPGRDKAR